jgi:hypothetical protein
MEALNPYVIDGKARGRLAALHGGTPDENAMRHRIACEAERGLLGVAALAALEEIHARHVPTVHLTAEVAPPVPRPAPTVSPTAALPPPAPPAEAPVARIPEPVGLFSPDYAASVYARRKADVQRHARGDAAPDAGSDSPPSTNTLDATDIYARRRQQAVAGGRR